VGCSGMISKGFCFVAFFEGVKASSFYIHLSCQVSINLCFFDRFSKNTHIKFHENPSIVRWVDLCLRTDRRTDMAEWS
jgi:hypothetical protein